MGIITLLVIEMMSPFAVFADDETPPETTQTSEDVPPPDEAGEETELATEQETDESSQPAADTQESTEVEDPASEQEMDESSQQAVDTQESAEVEEPASEPKTDESNQQATDTEEAGSTSESTAPDSAASSSQEEETASDTEESEIPEEDLSVAEVLEQAPEGTQVVVINEDGEIEPLVTEEAAQIIEMVDPIWCPAGQTPGDGGCTLSYTTVTDLIYSELSGQKSGAGTIYFTPTYSTNDATFDHNNLTNLTSLTIQGGWNGKTGAEYALSGVTTFSVPLTVTNWAATVSLKDITVDGASGDGITVETTGSINLENVSSNNNTGDGAYLDNTSGSGSVTLIGKNTFNGNKNTGLDVHSNGNIQAKNLTANKNYGNGVVLQNQTGSGSITLNGMNQFNDNVTGYGLTAQSNGNITVSNITANNNFDNGVYLSNIYGSGSVEVNGVNSFNDNPFFGLRVYSNGDITVNDITATHNSYPTGGTGVYLNNSSGSGSVTVNGGKYCYNQYKDITVDTNNTFTANGPYTANKTSFNYGSDGGIDAADPCPPEQPTIFTGVVILSDTPRVFTISYPIKPVQEASTTTGEAVAMDCAIYRGTQLSLPSGDSAFFACPPVLGSASLSVSLSEILSDSLPGSLPDGNTFLSGFTASFTEDDVAKDTLGAPVTLSFTIPEGMDASSLAILFWDGTGWVEQSVFVSADGTQLQSSVNFTGDFVLVSR